MSDDDSDSRGSSSPSSDDEEEEEVFEDVIANPQNEDDKEDNRVFRKWKWHQSSYDFIVGYIRKSGQTAIPCCNPYFWSRSTQTFNFDISSYKGEVDTLDLAKLNNEFESIEENGEVCARIGRHCIKNQGIRYLHVTLWSLEREGIVGFFQHWKGEHSQLLGLELHAPNLGDAGRLGGVGVDEIMERFLHGNTTLKELHLNWTGMNLNNAIGMANIISRNSATPLVNLGLCRNQFGDEGVKLLSAAISKISTIRKVNLSETGIRKYSSIMPLIINSSCKLERLDISNLSYGSDVLPNGFHPKNDIDDEFVSQMAVDLAGNRSLAEVILPEKNKITEAGWASLLQAVCDATNFDTLISSNHVLTSFGSCVKVGQPNETTVWKVGEGNDAIVWFDEMMQGASCPKLAKVLSINRKGLSPVDSARWKIYLHYFQAAALSIDDSYPAKSFLCEEVLALKVKLMPMVLSNIGTGKYPLFRLRMYDNSYPCNYSYGMMSQNHQIMYRLVRHMPDLFSFLSSTAEEQFQLRGNNDDGMINSEIKDLKRTMEPTSKEGKKLCVMSAE